MFRLRCWHEVYYATTLAFALLDAWAGANLRAVGFAAAPGLRACYYAACLGCFCLIRLRPGWAAPVTLFETSVNLTVLCAAILGAPLLLAEGAGAAGTPLDLRGLLSNFAICGSAGLVAFYQSLGGFARHGTGRSAGGRSRSPDLGR